MPDKRPLSFVDGVGTGIAGMMLIPLLFFARSAESFAGMYRDLGGYELLPITSRVVLHPLWSWIGLASMVSLSTWVLVSRPRFRYAMVAVAVFLNWPR